MTRVSFTRATPGPEEKVGSLARAGTRFVPNFGPNPDTRDFFQTSVIHQLAARGVLDLGPVDGPEPFLVALVAWGPAQVGQEPGDRLEVIGCCHGFGTEGGGHRSTYRCICTSSRTHERARE